MSCPMLLRVLLLIVTVGCLTANAQIHAPYEDERARILALPLQQRLAALENSAVFDTETALGKYFFNSVHLHTKQFRPFYTLSDEEVSTLKTRFPVFFTERRIQQLQFSRKTPAKIIQELEALRRNAQDQHWDRVIRWATAALVQVQIAEGMYYSAILNMLEVSGQAPHTGKESPSYDYPLVFVYRDLAEAFYQAGDYQKSLIYCQKYQNVYPEQTSTTTRGLLCRARAEIKSGEYDSALRLTAQAIEKAQNAQMSLELLSAYRLLAEAYLEQENFPLAESYAVEALNYASSVNHHRPTDYFLIYALITAAKIEQQQLQEAKRYYLLVQKHRLQAAQGAYYDSIDYKLKADIAYLEGNHSEAIHFYRDLIKLNERHTSAGIPWAELQEMSKTLDDQQLSYLKVKSELDQAQTKNMTMLAVFTTALGLVGLIAFIRMFRQKQKIEKFSRLDYLTSVNNRWHAVQILRRRLSIMDRKSDVICIALIDIDHFKIINDHHGHDAGDAVLVHIAKFFKYQLRSKDVFGRYGGEEFVLMLEDTCLTDAKAKLNELHRRLENLPVPDMQISQPLRFSCGLAEVKGKASLDEVISYCDHLLYEAKRHGRNHTRAGAFLAEQNRQRA